MVACQNADCFRPAEPDLKLSDRRVNSGARIGSDRLRPDGESLVRLSIEKQMLGPFPCHFAKEDAMFLANRANQS